MDYHFKTLNKQCAGTGKPLEPGTSCRSVLVRRHGELVRLDFSDEGWSGPPEGTVGYWRCVVPLPVDCKAKSLDGDALMRYFEQLTEEPNPATEKMRYVVALMLLQKKRLRLEHSQRVEDVDVLELAGSRDEGRFEIQDWKLNDTEIAQVQAELRTQLNTEWS